MVSYDRHCRLFRGNFSRNLSPQQALLAWISPGNHATWAASAGMPGFAGLTSRPSLLIPTIRLVRSMPIGVVRGSRHEVRVPSSTPPLSSYTKSRIMKAQEPSPIPRYIQRVHSLREQVCITLHHQVPAKDPTFGTTRWQAMRASVADALTNIFGMHLLAGAMHPVAFLALLGALVGASAKCCRRLVAERGRTGEEGISGRVHGVVADLAHHFF